MTDINTIPPIPTEHGWYLDREGDPWKCTERDLLRPEYAPYRKLYTVEEATPIVAEEIASWFHSEQLRVEARIIRSKYVNHSR